MNPRNLFFRTIFIHTVTQSRSTTKTMFFRKMHALLCLTAIDVQKLHSVPLIKKAQNKWCEITIFYFKYILQLPLFQTDSSNMLHWCKM